jgi:hypothetical protein
MTNETTIYVSPTLGGTHLAITNNPETVGDCMEFFFKGDVPEDLHILCAGREVYLDTPVHELRANTLLVRTGDFARKKDITGAAN